MKRKEKIAYKEHQLSLDYLMFSFGAIMMWAFSEENDKLLNKIYKFQKTKVLWEYKKKIETTANECIKAYRLRNSVAFYYYVKFMTWPK